jgi:hypothetical protein
LRRALLNDRRRQASQVFVQRILARRGILVNDAPGKDGQLTFQVLDVTRSQPAWLTEVAYAEKIQPLLAVVRPADIMNAIGVSWLYASQIRCGMKRRMHGMG